jgi:phage major head subunit gpT-like protein
VNISRQMIVNDDLGAFLNVAESLGRAAALTIEKAVYAMLLANPTMSDGFALFHANHKNLQSTGTALTVTNIDADRVAMAKQMDVGGNDYLDIKPSVLLLPVELGGTARVINRSEYDPDATNKLQRINPVAGLFSDIIDSPRLSGTARYYFADPEIMPAFEVAFLNGNDTPYLEQQTGFDTDGVQYKVRLDFGVAAIESRAVYKNLGA